MADSKQAIDFVIDRVEDDHENPGVITQLRGDSGGRTRLGLTQAWHKKLSDDGYFEGDPLPGFTNPLKWEPTKVDRATARATAEAVYMTEYAEPLSLDKIESQDLANLFLAYAVNAGKHQAIVDLQRAAGIVTPDGRLGPATLRSVKAQDGILDLFRAQQVAFYSHLGGLRSEKLQYAEARINRLATNFA